MTFEFNSKKRSLSFLKKNKRDNIKIGILVTEEDAQKLGLINIGDSFVPSPINGPTCEKNAIGYEYADKTQPKEYRYVSTIMVYPYGNIYADQVPVDQYRYCYPKVIIPPTEIELTLVANDSGSKFILANLEAGCPDSYYLYALNMFIEIFGRCFVFEENLVIDAKRTRVNWQILPPGERPSNHIKHFLEERKEDSDTFDAERLKIMEQYKSEEIVQGVNGFFGYFVYIFKNCCVLESAIYGNATYIIPKENWEDLSKKTKKELFDNRLLIAKIIHTANWEYEIRDLMKNLEKQSPYYWR